MAECRGEIVEVYISPASYAVEHASGLMIAKPAGEAASRAGGVAGQERATAD
jgi:hypothetical protein